MLRFKRQVLDEREMDRVLDRITHQILERSGGVENLVVIGIRTRGVPLAKRLVQKLEAVEEREVPFGILDINLYRDDLSLASAQPVIRTTDVPFDINGKVVVLVDDVLFTGRTVRSALDALIDLGRPRAIQLAVLVDRGHRELPISADFVGKEVPTAKNEVVKVCLAEIDGQDAVNLMERC
ncbi:MAG: bifunctional pyr operon transcriptional regulator/uracil phosphoribosyltransferase PyrR [Limnochordia bacterium]|jgi:pyrimidine operon attenuation protein/uracil phosphoribosyltransferase|nr:bifunctional pyr operon transcriptional regulator/uracil phosphoribosyltransferase PyrR [Limnochordia bacterium]MDD2629419.1 bifunctional pyr operon transcriptional regulator/uracil phosphoribosyltransferase PyrR [Limnochordia bacterium]MDD4518532.1 bifunctional pyr operon transcriptional regulator/uracil phosphoribosyltransferase PyrR [Limnochordia bacterium]